MSTTQECVKEDALLEDDQMTLGQAIDIVYDPYDSVRSESIRELNRLDDSSYPYDEDPF